MKCILHIGQQKTGSTFLQHNLSQSREHLLSNGYLYPSSLGLQKQNKLLSSHDDLADENSDVYKSFIKEISESNVENIICSEENLFSIPEQKITNIYNFLSKKCDSFEIVVYLRRQDDHFLSIYQQNIRGKVTETIKDYLNSESLYQKYSYNNILMTWQRAFKDCTITIKPYGHLKNGDIIDDFYDFLKIEKSHYQQQNNYAISNKSFDAESIELIRYFNILEQEEKVILPHSMKRKLRVFLKNKQRGPKFSLSMDDKLKIWNTYKDENEKLCSNFNFENNSYFKNKPKHTDSKPLYNHHIKKDVLYELFFDVFDNE